MFVEATTHGGLERRFGDAEKAIRLPLYSMYKFENLIHTTYSYLVERAFLITLMETSGLIVRWNRIFFVFMVHIMCSV